MYIYKIRNKINNKLYVGQTRRKLSETKTYYGSGRLIQRALNKYGIENFEKTILEFCPTQKTLNTSEIYWINNFNSMLPFGYNITEGGGGVNGYTHSDIQLNKIRESTKKHWKSDEYRDKIMQSRREYWTDEKRMERSLKVSSENNPMYGKSHSEETKMIISKKNTGNVWTDERKETFSKTHSGKNNYFFGKYHTDKTRKELSRIATERFKNKDERKKISESVIEYYKTHDGSNKGRKFSKQTISNMKLAAKLRWRDESFRKKYSESRKNRKWMNKDGIRKLIKPDEVKQYINDNWIFGMGDK